MPVVTKSGCEKFTNFGLRFRVKINFQVSENERYIAVFQLNVPVI